MEATRNCKESTIHVDIVRVERRARELGFRHASIGELAEGIRLAESLMGAKIATPDAVMRMDVVTGMTAWVTGDPIEGVFLVLPLSPAGEQAVRDGTYCPADPAPAHLAWQAREAHVSCIPLTCAGTASMSGPCLSRPVMLVVLKLVRSVLGCPTIGRVLPIRA